MAAEAGALDILQLCAPADVGGLERVVQGLSIGLAARGHRVTVLAVVTADADPDPFFAPMAAAGVSTLTLELGARAYLRERREVAEVFRRLRPHVLHTHGYRPDLLHGAVARQHGIATVSTLHGSSRMGGLSQLFEWVQERALRRFDGVVAVSQPLVGDLKRRGVPEDHIHYVPNAWSRPEQTLPREEARSILALAAEARVLGWIGRLIPVKGPDVFVRALAELEPAGWVACVIGDGPMRPELERLAAELGLGERVRFAGAVHDAARLLSAFDLFVLSSRSEGTPMVLVEAMAAGTPVIATAVGGIPFAIEDGAEAWTVPPESPARLAEAIRDALARPNEALLRSGRASARYRRDFDAVEWIRRHEALYRTAMAIRARAHA